MSLKMSEEDKNRLLDQASVSNGNDYKVKLWACIMADAKDMTAIGGLATVAIYSLSTVAGAAAVGLSALNNEYCYVGLTGNEIIICVVKKIDCSKEKYTIKIPLSNITSVSIRQNKLFKRSVARIQIGSSSLTLSLMDNAIGTNIRGQKENVEKLLDALRASCQQ